LSEQFPNASWTLQAELPTSPTSATVFKVKNPSEISVESVRSLANKFGMKGNIYQRESGQRDFHSYLVIDDVAQLMVFGHNQAFSYLPDVFRPDNEHYQPLPFEQVSARAEAFLKEKGLLDFPYRVEPGIMKQNVVMINRQLDENLPLLPTDPNSPEFLVAVAADGNILEVRGQIPVVESSGTYPLRSASDAWQALLNGKIGGRFGYQVAKLIPPAVDMTWAKQYQPGQHVEVYGVPQTLKPADGSQPVVMMDNLALTGELPSFPEENQPILHITGTMLSKTNLQVETVEISNIPPSDFGFTGLIQSDGINMTIQTMDGRNLVIANAPAGLPVDEPASVNGYLLPDGRMEWTNIFAGPSICSSFSSSFQYSDVSAGGGGGGRGGGGGGGGEGDMCSKYPNMVGRIVSGGFDNLQVGSAMPGADTPKTPYQPGDRIDGLTGEINGNNLVKPNGTRIPQFFVAIPDQSGLPSWNANLVGEHLTGLENHLHMQVRVWGTFQIENNNPAINVERWELVAPAEKVEVWQGSLEVGNVSSKKAFILSTADGTKYVLKSSLNYPPEALQVPPASPEGTITIEGVLLSEKMDGFAIIREVMMDNGRALGDLQPQSTQMMDIMPPAEITELISGQVNISQARLVYLSMQFAGGSLPADHPARTLQPLWEFSGTLQDGRKVSLFVQAVEDAYLK
jgi:hypothetical protein